MNAIENIADDVLKKHASDTSNRLWIFNRAQLKEFAKVLQEMPELSDDDIRSCMPQAVWHEDFLIDFARKILNKAEIKQKLAKLDNLKVHR